MDSSVLGFLQWFATVTQPKPIFKLIIPYWAQLKCPESAQLRVFFFLNIVITVNLFEVGVVVFPF